jgi:hypothetical protein
VGSGECAVEVLAVSSSFDLLPVEEKEEEIVVHGFCLEVDGKDWGVCCEEELAVVA